MSLDSCLVSFGQSVALIILCPRTSDDGSFIRGDRNRGFTVSAKSSKMSELRTSGFFRPWHIPETAKASGIVSVDDTLHDTSCNRQEDDDESVVSSATSTTSVTSSTTVETSEKYNDHLLDRDTANSRSLNAVRHRARRRRRSESSDDVATSTTLSLEGENVVGSTVQDARNKSRAFRSKQPVDSTTPAVSDNHDSDKFNRSSDVSPLEYLSAFEFRRPEVFAQSINDETYSIANSDIAGPSSAAVIPELYYAFTDFHSGIHPGIQSVVQPGILPSDFYNRSMEEAVQMIHRQDAVAKQMKKMRPKKFRCQYCDVAFSNNGQLKGHVRIHTG